MVGALRKRLRKRVGLIALARHSTVKKFANLCFNQIERRLVVTKPRSLPYRLVIDITNVCNLHCPFCPTGKGLRGRSKGFMGIEQYKGIIDEIGDYIYLLDLYNWGEPLLHKSVYDMVTYAKERNICTRISTNFNVPFSEEAARRMVESGLPYLTVSCDGVDQQSYDVYRRGGTFATVLENMERLVKTREHLGASNPYIFWLYLVFKHNEHLADDARLAAERIGVDAVQMMIGGVEDETWAASGNYPPIPGLVEVPCSWLWKQLVIHWDGGIAPCCGEFWKIDDYGSLGDKPIRELWNNEKFVKSRFLFKHRQETADRTEAYCASCYKLGGSRRPWNEFPRNAAEKLP